MKTDEIKFTVECLDEHIPIKGNAIASGDNEYDRKVEEKLKRQLRDNPWAWCSIKVIGEYRGLTAVDYLGCCSYKNEKDFRNSPYFKDMRDNVIADLQEQVNRIIGD